MREKTLELIEKKIAGQEITAAPAEESKTKIIDLMAALKASMEGDESRKPAARAGKKGISVEEPEAKKKPARRRAG